MPFTGLRAHKQAFYCSVNKYYKVLTAAMGGGYGISIPVSQINRLRLRGIDLNLGLRTSKSCRLHVSFGHRKEGVLLDSSLEFELQRVTQDSSWCWVTQEQLCYILSNRKRDRSARSCERRCCLSDPPSRRTDCVRKQALVTFGLEWIPSYHPSLSFCVGQMGMLMSSQGIRMEGVVI